MKFQFNLILKKLYSRKFVIRCVVLLFTAYLVLGAYFYCCDQDEWLTEPNVDPPSYKQSSGRATNFPFVPLKLSPSPNDGTDLADVHYRRYPALSAPVRGTVLYFHGNKGNMHKCESQLEIFFENQYDVWTMDYREFGDSTGELSEKALLGDAKRVYDEMILSGVKESDVVIWGRSFGSGVAASVVAAGATPKMLVLETPYWSLPDAARSNYLLLPDFVFHYQLPNHQYLSKANSECRIELIHGTYDEKIPFSSSERLYLRCRELNLPVRSHPIMCGPHDLRPDPEFKVIVQRILK